MSLYSTEQLNPLALLPQESRDHHSGSRILETSALHWCERDINSSARQHTHQPQLLTHDQVLKTTSFVCVRCGRSLLCNGCSCEMVTRKIVQVSSHAGCYQVSEQVHWNETRKGSLTPHDWFSTLISSLKGLIGQEKRPTQDSIRLCSM
jgi:hypothetical protein